MIATARFYRFLRRAGVDFFTGVPDSVLRNFIACVSRGAAPTEHMVAANEGGAIAMAAGHYLATGRPALVYLQNSGLGNAANPLLSLTHPRLYRIPMLLLIGWRGQPGRPDEPQHIPQGNITRQWLASLGVRAAVLPGNSPRAERAVAAALREMRRTGASRALLVPAGAFSEYSAPGEAPNHRGELTRAEAIGLITRAAERNAVFVATTGKTSRELFAAREAAAAGHARDFLVIGSMGHASSLAWGIALRQTRPVYCLDGDGAALMHLGAWAVIGAGRAGKFRHILLNNGTHDSVGGQPVAGAPPDYLALARGCGYRTALRAANEKEILQGLKMLRRRRGPALLEILVRGGAREGLGRPSLSLTAVRAIFMEQLKK